MPGNRKEPATIHDFAPETLSAVFSLVSLAAPPRRIYIKEGKTYVRPMYDLGWIPLAHVSRQWRGIALNTSFLWASTIPHLPRLEIYEIPLARSRQTPLSIATIPDTYSHNEYNAAIYEYALERTNNVRSLSLHFGHRWSSRRQLDVQARAALCDNPLPRLTDLSLDVTLMGTEVKPETLLIDAPNLVSVSLRGIRCIFPSQNLLHLSYRIGVGQQGSAGNLLELLRHTPLLQTLRVSVDLVRPSDASPASNTNLVHLSHLKLLCASLDQARDGDQIGDAEFFIKLLSFPPSCVVHLNDDVGRPLDNEGNKTLKICGDLFRRLPYDCVAFHAFDEWVRGFSLVRSSRILWLHSATDYDRSRSSKYPRTSRSFTRASQDRSGRCPSNGHPSLAV
ncbi:hypothetical protein PENSPDRAFT_382576 [Peniophora sp. CONT]|nr:hypothetical protein PENSPDRAFT_382576 [Peniophora sp. CONT]